MRRQLLLVTYLFPPAGGVGVQRALSAARYLPEVGVDVTVLTARDPISQHGWDPDLQRKIPAQVKVIRAAAWEPPRVLRDKVRQSIRGEGSGVRASRADNQRGKEPFLKRMMRKAAERLLFPDAQLLWVRPSLREAARIIEREGIGSVVLTLPPFSLLEMAGGLRRRFPDLRIALDLRDEWLDYHLREYDPLASPWKREQAARLERVAVAASNLVITVTETWAEGLRRRYPGESASKFICIPNGYDPDQTAGLERRPAPPPPVVIGYMGTLYANQVYSPDPYLRAIEAMPEEWTRQVETRFFGRVAPDAQALLTNRKAVVVQTGFLPQAEAFRRLSESHGLLLIVGNPTVHSAKLFEYLAMGIPILAISPPHGEVGRVIRETRSGWCVAPEDQRGIQEAIREIHAIANGEKSFSGPDHEAVARYDRRRLAAEMARALGL